MTEADEMDLTFEDATVGAWKVLAVAGELFKRLRERGGDLAIVGVSGSPLKVLSITGIDRVIPIFDDATDLPQD